MLGQTGFNSCGVCAIIPETCHLGFSDLAALLVGAGVERALDFEARLSRGDRDQLDNGQAIGERSAAPVLRDMAEQAVLYSVPLRGARWIVVHVKHEAGLVGEFLQLHFPEPYTRAHFFQLC